MDAAYDEAGNYIYPEGFDPDTQAWLPGFETQQAEWERQYAEAQTRFEAHQKQVTEARAAEAAEGTPSTFSSDTAAPAGSAVDEDTLRRLQEQFGTPDAS